MVYKRVVIGGFIQVSKRAWHELYIADSSLFQLYIPQPDYIYSVFMDLFIP